MNIKKLLLAALFSTSSLLADFPYATELQGNRSETTSSAYSIMTLNVCMMDHDLPTRWGGMTPAKDRVDPVANFILDQDPDIFLGQEIMTDSGQRLYEKLKGRYTYFWIGIGKVPGKEESGLFVASKRPISGTPQFVPFPDEDQVDRKFFPNQTRFLERGFFALDLGGFWVVNTHLEGGDAFVRGPEHRIRQLQIITEQMDQIAKGKPYIVAGDLNLNRTGEPNDDYSRSNIQADYYDFYTSHHPAFDETTFTCTNYFTAVANNQPLPALTQEKYEIDDYVLIRAPHQDRFSNLNVTLLGGTYDVNAPREAALTDHKAYKATFSFEE